MADDVLIRVENVGKKYCRSLKRSMFYGLQDIARDTIGFNPSSDTLRKDEFWVVNDVSFEVKRGECLGIIGPNGAGKSTLLKMLNGIILPDKGKIAVRGRVGALIEVGAGFHPMLTGRENVYLNGSILGLTKKEIDRKFDEIVAFAELDDFIDMPVKHYSSGMYVRLGFAIAAHLEPDILLLDEVLAVGDMQFQAKCIQSIGKIRSSGSALIFISHNMHQMSIICDHGFVIDHGCCVINSFINEAINTYTASLFAKNKDTCKPTYWSSSKCAIELISINKSSNALNNVTINPKEPFSFEFRVYNQDSHTEDVIVDTRIEDSLGTVAQQSSEINGSVLQLVPGANSLTICFDGIARQGEHISVNVAIWSKIDRSILAWSRGHKLFVTQSMYSTGREACIISYTSTPCTSH